MKAKKIIKRKETSKKAGLPKKPSPRGKYLLAGLGVLVLGTLAFIGYRTWKKKNEEQDTGSESNADSSPFSMLKTVKRKPAKRSWKDDSLPLSEGSSGPRVLQLQKKLNSKHSAGLIEDGLFGAKTKAALLKFGYKSSVDDTAFNQITDGEPTLVFNPGEIANQLFKAARESKIDNVLAALSRIGDKTRYSSVNTQYKNISDHSLLTFGQSRTIVTDLLDYAFKSAGEKEKIKAALTKIGLTQNAGRWQA